MKIIYIFEKDNTNAWRLGRCRCNPRRCDSHAYYQPGLGQVAKWYREKATGERIMFNMKKSWFYFIILKILQLLDLLKRIDNDWTVLSVNESSMEILRTYAERGRTLTITYAIAVYMSVTSFTLLPAIPIVLNIVAPLNESRPKKMLYEAEYGVDDEKYYYYMLVHWYFTSFACICVFVTNDTMYSVWVQHCCALFAIVG